MPRDTRLTLWPEQVDLNPLLNSFEGIRQTDTLDLSYCTDVDSCGLAISALCIKRLFRVKGLKKKNDNAAYIDRINRLFPDISDEQIALAATEGEPLRKSITEIQVNASLTLMHHITALGFFESLKPILSEAMEKKYCAASDPIQPVEMSEAKTSYPIVSLPAERFSACRRDMVDFFLERVEPVLDNFFLADKNKSNPLLSVLAEIVKNIADHSGADGVCGMTRTEKSGISTLSMAIGDSGPGLYAHLRDYLIAKKGHRVRKTGIVEVYRYALQPGISSKHGEENSGYGMPMIVDVCHEIGCRFYAFDAQSRLLISNVGRPISTKPPSYNELNRVCLNTGVKRPFIYYIQCERRQS